MDGELSLNSPGRVLRNLWNVYRGEPHLWDNARFILADVPLDRGEAKKVLPLGLWLDEPANGTLFVVNYTRTSFTVPYHEAALLLHVRSPLGRGRHCCWMVVDDDTALIYGRELLGYPKKMAGFEFQESGDTIRAAVTRRGVKVLEMEGTRGSAQNPAPAVFQQKTFNAGAMGQYFVFSPIWLFKPTEIIHESYTSEVKLTFNNSDYDPIGGLISGGPVNGRIVVMDIPGAKYMVPVGLAGIRWFANTFYLRFR